MELDEVEDEEDEDKPEDGEDDSEDDLSASEASEGLRREARRCFVPCCFDFFLGLYLAVANSVASHSSSASDWSPSCEIENKPSKLSWRRRESQSCLADHGVHYKVIKLSDRN